MVGLLGADVESYFLEGSEMKMEVGKKYKRDGEVLLVHFITHGGTAWGQLNSSLARYVSEDEYHLWTEYTEPKPPQYVPYTWDDREQLRGRWYRRKGHNDECFISSLCEVKGELRINHWTAATFLDTFVWLDGTPCGKVVE